MTVPINELGGISATVADRFRQAGISNSEQLLAAARTPADRNTLAGKIGAQPETILELVNRADLARIKGIASVFGDLLEVAGVDTVKELANRNPENLHATLTEINEETKLSGRPAGLKEVQDWVSQAKVLPRALEY